MGCGQVFSKEVPAVSSTPRTWSSPAPSSSSDGFWIYMLLEILINVLVALF